MEINITKSTHPVTYYEVISTTGLRKTITIDSKSGDTYNESDITIEVVIASKPFLEDPTKTIPAQHLKIFKRDIFAIESWTVEVQDQPANFVPKPTLSLT